MAGTTTELLEDLRRFHLLAPLHLDDLARRLQGQSLGPRGVAQDLIARGWLTPFQANQLLQGKAGGLLQGPYVLLERLGEGGMGAVYKARNWQFGQTVALKLMHKNLGANNDAVRRFQREIQAAAQLNHPNIVRAIDAGEGNGNHMLVMEYVEGTDLEKQVRHNGPLPVEQAVGFIVQAAQGLAHAHAAGIIHRDVKPSNLVLDKQGVVKVLDLGLARVTGAEKVPGAATAPTALTQSGSIMGTCDYMAPEQALDTKRAGQRADIYSLGCTLWFLLTGRVLYGGETVMAQLLVHRMKPIPSLSDARPEVPPSLDAVFRRMVAKEPEDRYASMDEVIAALVSRMVEPTISGPVPAGLAAPPPGSARIGNRRRRLLAAGGGLLLLIGVCGFRLMFPTTPPALPTTAAPPGKERFALEFDGYKSHVIIPNWKYKGNHPLTIEAWAVSGAETGHLMGDWEKAGIGLSIKPVSTIREFPSWSFMVFDGQRYQTAWGSEPAVTGRRVHVAGVLDGREARLYVNGRFQGLCGTDGGYRVSPMPFLIGANPDTAKNVDGYITSGGFAGKISEVRISRVARYSAAFTPAARFEPDELTVGLYHLDEGDGFVAHDSSANQQHGRIKGARWVRAD